jgi:prepilin-type N-terminal cleavage/methylation domain-containing protein
VTSINPRALRVVIGSARNGSGAAGFTLVETLVTMVLASIIAVVLWGTMKMYYDNIDLCFINIRLQRTFDAVVTQIGTITQQASLVLATGDSASSYDNTVSDTCDSIHIIMPSGTDTARYCFNGGYLWEKVGAAAWDKFICAPRETVTVATSAVNKFYLTPDRKTLTITLKMWMKSKNKTDTLRISGVQYLCRN